MSQPASAGVAQLSACMSVVQVNHIDRAMQVGRPTRADGRCSFGEPIEYTRPVLEAATPPSVDQPISAAPAVADERAAKKPGRGLLRTLRGWRVPALVALALALLNLWFFRDVYQGRAAFPWDFRQTYHAIPFYWHALVRIAQFPEWIPYQAVGYPLQLPLQTGLYYPPLWVFPIFRILYSLQTAAIFQCLHVLTGALGMVWLARTRGLSWLAAALAGMAYQFFGGFFCNAEHVDIVRGYALLPLLLAGLTFAENRRWRQPTARFWSIPLSTLLIATGAYPGQLPPVLAASGLYLLMQVFDGERTERRARAGLAGAHLAMLLLGLLLAAPNLGPALLLKDEIDRSLGPVNAEGLVLDHVFTTVFGYHTKNLTTDVSMNSFFVTLPVLVGLFFVPWAIVRRQRALVAVSIAAALLIPAGTLYLLVVRLLPSFGYSRFPIADYRALLAVPVFLLGALGLERLVRADDRWSSSDALRGIALVAFLAAAAHRFKWSTLPSPQVRDVVLLLAGLAVPIGLARVRRLPDAFWVVTLGLLVLLDGSRMHNLVTLTWKGPPDKRDFESVRQDLQRSLRTELAARPARQMGGWVFTRRDAPNLNGYLRGSFVADDFAVSEHLRVIAAVRSDKSIASYMYGASHPKLVEEAPGLGAAQIAAAPDSPAAGSVKPRLFEAERVIYEISAPGKRILVENEPAFAGWRGFAHCADAGDRVKVRPVPELWPLRAWRVPEGQYRFCAGYRLPGLRPSLLLAALAAAAWAGAGALCWWRGRRHRRAT